MDEENFAHNGDPLTQNWGMVDGSHPWYREYVITYSPLTTTKPLLKLGHWWVITSHGLLFIYSAVPL